ncbi:MAG: hypothetical protein ACI3YB_03035 [Prevotella sp.]
MDFQDHIHHHRNGNETKNEDRFFKIRNILNIIFMIVAVVGMLVYYTIDHTSGIVTILTSIVFKLAECCLRLFRR